MLWSWCAWFRDVGQTACKTVWTWFRRDPILQQTDKVQVQTVPTKTRFLSRFLLHSPPPLSFLHSPLSTLPSLHISTLHFLLSRLRRPLHFSTPGQHLFYQQFIDLQNKRHQRACRSSFARPFQTPKSESENKRHHTACSSSFARLRCRSLKIYRIPFVPLAHLGTKGILSGWGTRTASLAKHFVEKLANTSL